MKQLRTPIVNLAELEVSTAVTRRKCRHRLALCASLRAVVTKQFEEFDKAQFRNSR